MLDIEWKWFEQDADFYGQWRIFALFNTHYGTD